MTDAQLICDFLRAHQLVCEINCVQTLEAYQRELSTGGYDVILSDFTLPSFDGLSALQMAAQASPDVPFIFVSGTIGEDKAVESLKNGAVDYVLKGYLSRLPAAVRRAVRDARERVERQRIEEELRQRNELFRQITENVDDLIAVLDLQGRRIFNSPSYCHLLSDPEALVGTDSFAQVHPEDRERIRKLFADTVATGRGHRAEYRFLRPDGSTRQVESQGSVIRDRDGRITNVVVVSRDVTDREHTQQLIREQAALLDQAPDAIFVRDLALKITYWNKGAERLYGWTSTEAIGRRAHELLGKPGSHDSPEAWQALFEHGDWIGELSQVTQTGREIIVSAHRTLLRDSSGNPVAIFSINTDITEKKQFEAQFLRSQRLENIGALAGGIAHDLNNVLAPVMMLTDLLREELKDENSRRMLDTVRASARRGSDLVKQILQFARGSGDEPFTLHLKHVIKETGALVRETFPRSIRLSIQIDEDLRLVSGDATKLHQVLLNLCLNARDAMPEGGQLAIKAANILLDRKVFPTQPQPISGAFVLLAVSDTGTGIPTHLLDRIFQPFFTTKTHNTGSGLGLSTVANIVRAHSGFIEVFSELEKGTTFEIYLPAAAEMEAVALSSPPKPPPVGRGEWVLLVDDERAILRMTNALLEACQYHVLSAQNGADALALFQQHKHIIDVVVTDLMMPIMDGPEFIQEIRRSSPEMKIIGMSGLAAENKLAEAVESNVQFLLRKPYTAAEMLVALRQTLSPSIDE